MKPTRPGQFRAPGVAPGGAPGTAAPPGCRPRACLELAAVPQTLSQPRFAPGCGGTPGPVAPRGRAAAGPTPRPRPVSGRPGAARRRFPVGPLSPQDRPTGSGAARPGQCRARGSLLPRQGLCGGGGSERRVGPRSRPGSAAAAAVGAGGRGGAGRCGALGLEGPRLFVAENAVGR